MLVNFIFIILILIHFIKSKFKHMNNPIKKAVLITGCGSGVGNRLALELNKYGYKVFATVHDINSIGAYELKTNAIFANKMIVLEMDVTKDDQVNNVFVKVKDELRSSGYELWSLVNNAGKITAGPLIWGTLETYRKVFDVNVFGTVLVTRLFLPLIKSSKGRIIIMNSISGHFIFKNMGIYSMTKHSLVAFTETLRRELAISKIKVCSIEPGYINTELSSLENMIKILDTVWNESSSEIKLIYGNPKNEIKQISDFKYKDILSVEIDKVVEDNIDAITNPNPKLIYKPMTLYFKFLMLFLKLIPMRICDKLMQ